MRECKSCGATFIKGEVRCPYCGSRLIPGSDSDDSQNPSGPQPGRSDFGQKSSGRREYSEENTQRDFRSGWEERIPPAYPFGGPPPLKMFQNKSNLVAMILALALGTFGAHWYYMGNPGRAKWYLIFFWTGIPTLVGLVEAVMFLHRFLSEDFTRLP